MKLFVAWGGGERLDLNCKHGALEKPRRETFTPVLLIMVVNISRRNMTPVSYNFLFKDQLLGCRGWFALQVTLPFLERRNPSLETWVSRDSKISLLNLGLMWPGNGIKSRSRTSGGVGAVSTSLDIDEG
jgi:hypothetical protein